MRSIAALVACLLIAAPAGACETTIATAPPPCVVLVTAPLGDGKAAFAAGVVIAQTQNALTIVTAAHVPNLDRARVLTQRGELLSVQRVHAIAGHDLAFVQTSAAMFTYPPARPSAADGDQAVFVWGFPQSTSPLLSNAFTVTPPPELVARTKPGEITMLCATCTHGDSGGGIFTSDGRLIGILTHGLEGPDGTPVLVMGEPVTALLAAAF